MNIKLVEPSLEHYNELCEYVNELTSSIDAEGTNRLYYAIKKNAYENWLEWINIGNSKTYLILNEEGNIVGIITLRYILNDSLKECGGHIGYNIRPSERRKGYASKALELILKNAHEYGLNEILIDCYKENIASGKTIESTGGTLYSEVYVDRIQNTIKRYKLDLNKKYRNGE